MSSYDAARVMADLRQEYAESELDNDRNPTEDGFVEWLARRATATRPTPRLDAVKAERDAAIARADSHRQAAHEAAGQLDALRRQRDQLDAALAELLDEVHIEIGTPECRDRVLAVHARARAVLHAVRGRGGAPGPVNEIEDGVPYPCQPIGCDNGYHLSGCVYASADCEDPWHSAPGETAPTDPCPTCGAKG